MEELVTIIITTYKRNNYFKETLNSILSQTYKNIEVLVVSDGFNQELKNYLNTIEGNIVFFEKKHSGIVAESRNIGLEKANGKYVAFCDDDDIWIKDKIESQIKVMKNTNSPLSFTDVFYIDSLGNEIFKNKFIFEFFFNFLSKYTNTLLYFKNYIPLSSILINTNLLKPTFDTKIEMGSEDYDFLLKNLSVGLFAKINEKKVKYRIHEANISKDKVKGYNRSIKILKSIKSKKLIDFFLIKMGVFTYNLKIKSVSFKYQDKKPF